MDTPSVAAAPDASYPNPKEEFYPSTKPVEDSPPPQSGPILGEVVTQSPPSKMHTEEDALDQEGDFVDAEGALNGSQSDSPTSAAVSNGFEKWYADENSAAPPDKASTHGEDTEKLLVNSRSDSDENMDMPDQEGEFVDAEDPYHVIQLDSESMQVQKLMYDNGLPHNEENTSLVSSPRQQPLEIQGQHEAGGNGQDLGLDNAHGLGFDKKDNQGDLIAEETMTGTNQSDTDSASMQVLVSDGGEDDVSHEEEADHIEDLAPAELVPIHSEEDVPVDAKLPADEEAEARQETALESAHATDHPLPIQASNTEDNVDKVYDGTELDKEEETLGNGESGFEASVNGLASPELATRQVGLPGDRDDELPNSLEVQERDKSEQKLELKDMQPATESSQGGLASEPLHEPMPGNPDQAKSAREEDEKNTHRSDTSPLPVQDTVNEVETGVEEVNDNVGGFHDSEASAKEVGQLFTSSAEAAGSSDGTSDEAVNVKEGEEPEHAAGTVEEVVDTKEDEKPEHAAGSAEEVVDTKEDKNLEHATGTAEEVMDSEETETLIEESKNVGGSPGTGVDESKDVRDKDTGDLEGTGEEVMDTKTKAQGKPVAHDTPLLGNAGPSLPARPTGLGRSVPPLEPGSRSVQRSSAASASQSSSANVEDRLNGDSSEGGEDAREKLQLIRVKFLRLAHRLGQSAHNVVVAQVLYRLGLAEQLRGGRSTGRTGAFSYERASVMAEEQEAAGQDDLDFGCTIMVLGKSGVGKSATINSLFDEVKSGTNAYTPATTKVQEITGTIHGIKLRVIDTPGLLNSFADQRHNEKIMASVKRYIKKSPPDIVLYFDRLDMQSRDYGDLPLLRIITDTFGAAVWFNAIVVLTHASSAPPDGANGVPVSYEMFVAQRSHVVQQTIRQAAGDMRLMNPVSLVENHAACRRNRAGQRVLPNGQVWKPQLLLLCFASKILAEANSLLKLQDSTPGKPFGTRPRVPPLPFLLSSLLQSRAQLKLPDEQVDDDDEEESESSDDEGDSDSEEEYDDLPPFRRLTRDELEMLDKEQRKVYFEELEYREKLFMKKQWKEEKLRRKEMKRRLAALPKEASQSLEDSFEEENASGAVPVPMPDMVLPPSFDSDNPSYRYRYLDTANQWLVRPVLETHGWDHDSGYDGLNVEKVLVIKKKIPVSISGQVTKDKKEANVQMECAASLKTGTGKVTMAGLDVQTIGKDLAYTLRSETRFSNFKRNKTTCGLAVTLLGDTIAGGMKLEDRMMVGKRLKLVVNGGALTGRGDVAYGGSLEATLRDKDYPIGHSLATLGLSVMDWHGDLAIGGNLQLQFQLGKSMIVGRANLNNRGAGQISIRASSSEQLQIALVGLIPLLRTLGNRFFSSSQPMQ